MNEADAKLIQEFKLRMTRIAKANRDEFKVTITTDEDGHHVEVIETADKHTLLSGDGATIAECLTDAVKDLPEMLEQWGYKDAK
jgi:hypothetical protein